MKVLILLEGMHPPKCDFSGLSIIYDNLKNLSHKKDVEIHVLTTIYPQASKDFKNWFNKEKIKNNVTFHYLNFNGRVPKKFLSIYYKLALLFKAVSLFKKHNFDIIHDYSSSPFLCLRTGLIKLLTKAKTIHTICTFNKGFFGSYKFVKFSNFCDRIIVLTNTMKRKYIEKGVKKKKIALIPLGVNFDKFNVKRRCKKNSIKILFLGPFIPRKGIFTLVKAANKLIDYNKKVKFVLGTNDYSGQGDEGNKEYLTKLIVRNKQNFKIINAKLDIPKLMSEVNLLVLPQDTPYGTLLPPLTLLEAMSNGLPVIASNTEGVNDVIINNKNGLLFRPKDYVGLYNIFKRAINDRFLVKRLARNAKLTAKKFKVKDISNKMYKLYKNLM